MVRRSWNWVLYVVWPLFLGFSHSRMFSETFLLAAVGIGVGAGLLDVPLRPTSEHVKANLALNKGSPGHRLGLRLGLALIVLIPALFISSLTLLAQLAGLGWRKGMVFALLLFLPHIVSSVARVLTALRNMNAE